jgi:coenzyme F420-0:L-glutamate ligase / coenzyme F420-1:gamma-L-glutamate ligase
LKGLQVIGVEGLPEIQAGDDLGSLIKERSDLRDGDVLVVAQKVVSKAEGRFRNLATVEPSTRARELAGSMDSDPRLVQVILDESIRLVRADRVLIVETRHGFVCANAGVDHSNVPGDDNVTLLPVDPDASATALRERLRVLGHADVGVVIADTFGRAWRVGIENVALVIAGL